MTNIELAKILIINTLCSSTSPLTREELRNKTCLKDEFFREAMYQLLEERKIEVTWDLLIKNQMFTLNKQGDKTMCHTTQTSSVPVKSLQNAIQECIDQYKSQKKDFSVFNNITKVIRKNVNDQAYYIESVWINKVPFNALIGELERQTIYHRTVLDKFNEMWENNPDPAYEVNFGGLYRIFKYKEQVAPLTVSSVLPAVDTANSNDPVVVVNQTTADDALDNFTNKLVSPEEKLKNRLNNYIQYGRPYRIKFNDDFIVINKGRTAWRRPCNAGYSLNRWAKTNGVYDVVQTLKKEGKIKFVKVDSANLLS
jgi:hypothetical protein